MSFEENRGTMGQRLSIIDLGTNTFHLLTVEIIREGVWTTLDRERIFVNLASEGIEWISDAAMSRGLATMERFKGRIVNHEAGTVIAVGTAALRTARNAGTFLDKVKEKTGIGVQVIPGDREADLIAKGVLAALPLMGRPILIMDIGGGSVEMILAHHGNVLFARSYPIGVAVLYGQFHSEEPLAPESLEKLDIHLDHIFTDLQDLLLAFPDTVLVGASGTFEVVESILDPQQDPEILPYSSAKPGDFRPIYKEIVSLTLDERLKHPDIPESRAQYIVVAVHLIEYMLRRVSQDVFYISNYAMKEGLVVEECERVRM